MGTEPPDRTLGRRELERMVRLVRPGWRLRDATLAERGWTAVYHLVVETGDGRRRCVLKAAPDLDRPTGIDAEARIQAVVREHTDIPVPAVLGAVDDHGDLRTPFFLMASLPGEPVPMAEVGALPDATLRRVARASGRYLGQLHGIDVAFDAFGDGVDYSGDPVLQGGRPSSDPARLVAPDGYASWPAQLRDWFEEDLDLLAGSRFADLAPALRRELARRMDALPAAFSPVLGRVDHGWFNLLVDRDAGTLEGVVDWGSRFAVPQTFDLAVAEYLLSGGWWTALPEVPDRRRLVRGALLSGYRREATVPSTLAAERACYQLSDTVRWMAVLEERAADSNRAVPPDRVEDAAAGFRAAVEAQLDR